MPRRNRISHARSRRSQHALKRFMQIETLERRQLMAADLKEVFGPHELLSRSAFDYVSQAGNAGSVSSQRNSDDAGVDVALRFDSSQATRLDLTYPGFLSDGSAFRFVYANASLDLRSEFGPGRPVASSKFLLGEISNKSVFEALPEIDADSQLRFRVSGKPEFAGASLIEVYSLDEQGQRQILRVYIEVVNAADGEAEGEAGDEWAFGETPSTVFTAIGEGEASCGMVTYSSEPTINEELTLANGPTGGATAVEPHSTFYQPVSPTDVGSFQFSVPEHWCENTLTLTVSGTATLGSDYTLGVGTVSPAVSGTALTYVGGTSQNYQLTIPTGVQTVELIVTPLPDQTETDAGETVTLAVDPSGQTFTGGPSNYQITASGSATVTISDELEGLNLSTENSTTKEFRSEAPYPAFIVKPDASGVLMAGSAYLRIDASAYGSATPETDYGLFLDPNDPYSGLLLTETPQGSGIWLTSDISLAGLSERRIYVKPVGDRVLEQTESIQVDLRTRAINGLPDMSHGSGTAQLEDEYVDARYEKDEKAGCSCSCTTCSDGSAVNVDLQSGSGTVTTADGLVKLFTGNQEGPEPVLYVGLTLPSGKVVPTSVDVLVQVIEKDADSQGNLRGLGRKLPANAQVSPSVTLDVPSSATAGSTLWFAIQTDLGRFLQSWTRTGTTPSGSTGITEQIVPLELLAHPNFPATKPDGALLVTADKFSGWVGHVNHAVRNQKESSIAPGFVTNAGVGGVERLVRNQSIMVPDLPTGGGSSGGKVAWETGSMLFRAEGGTSWFKNNTQAPPESQDTLSGDIITDSANNKKRFNSVGDLVERIDAAGNSTKYTYNADGTVATIEDGRTQVTSFQYGVDGSGNKTLLLSRQNSAANASLNRQYSLTWTPFTTLTSGTFKVHHDDPDGTGPRQAREDVYTYDSRGYLTQISSGPVGAPTHTTTISHRTGVGGSRRLSSITYPDGSSVTLDLPKLENSAIHSDSGGTITTSDPRAFVLTSANSNNPLPSYAVITERRSSSSEPQRSIVQLDHRGRVLRSWDPLQVYKLGLEAVDLSGGLTSAQTQLLQSNIDLSYEYSVATPARDSVGRITTADWGEILATRTPDPDKVVSGGVLVSNGPATRQETTYSYNNNNIVGIQRPLQSAETLSWNDTFDVPVSYIDATSNKFYQTVNSTSGLVTEQLWETTPPVWQNQSMPQDVNGDGAITSSDSAAINTYLSTNGSGPVPAGAQAVAPFYDVNGDDNVTAVDAQLIDKYLTSPVTANLVVAEPVVLRKLQYTYTDGLNGLPKGLFTQQRTVTGRSGGDSFIDYAYYNTPTDKSKHGRLQSITESAGTSLQAVTTFDYDARGNLNLVTDPAGRQTKMYYDSRDRLIAQFSADPDGTGPLLPTLVRYDYDVFDNVVASELISTKLEGTQLLTTAVATSAAYDAGNRVTAQYQQRSSVTWYLYLDASGNIQRTTSRSTAVAGSLVTAAALTALAQSNSVIPNLPGSDAALQGLKTTYTYFASGTPNSVTVTQIDMAASTPAATERTWKTTLDRLGRVESSVAPDPGGGLTTTADDQRENGGFITRASYDNVGNVSSITNGLNQTTSFSYDALNRLTKLASPSATSGGATVDTLYSYAATRPGWKITQTDPAGGTATTQLDSLGRSRSVSGTAVPAKELRYWTDGGLKTAADERGNVTDFEYDTRGRLTSVTTPAPQAGAVRSVTSYQYTVDSLPSSVIDPLGRVTSFSYDAGGRNSRVTEPDPDGTGPATAAYTDFTYDSLGNLLTQTDALGQTTSFTLDSLFQTLTSTDPAGAVTTFAYDSFGNVTSVVDPLSNSTLYTYNKLGQVVSEDKPVSGVSLTRTYSYDGLGNLRSLADRNGRTTEWSYDGRSRVTAETWKTGTTVNRTLIYGYDTLDRTTTLDDSDALATDFQFAYDARSQLQSERQVTGLVGTSVVLDRDYDGDGNRTGLTTNFGATLSGTSIVGGVKDSAVSFSFDALNRLYALSQGTASLGSALGVNTVAPKSAYFQFNAASQLTDLRRYDATSANAVNLKVHSRYGFDSAGRLTHITHGKSEIAAGEVWDGTSTMPASLGSANMLAGYVLSYDADNRVTSLSSQRDAFKTSYTYDTTDQLTGASSGAISGMTLLFPLPESEAYNLDANGNRESSSGASQSASGTHNRLQTDGTYNYVYDNEGNVTQRTLIATGAVTDYTWDHRNRLVSVTERASAGGAATKTTEFVYDAFDQRVAKRHDADGNGSWDKYEAFVWADGHEILRFLDSDGEGTGQVFRVANRYLYADAVDQLISDEQYTNNTGPVVGATSGSATAGNTLWALADHLGSVRDVVDNSGVVRQHVVFDSFGRRLREVDYDAAGAQIASSNAAAIDELFGYTGRDWDADVGLQYNRARWYDPSTGRWMSQDPIGFAAGDANLYRYVANHPTNSRDPSGLKEPYSGSVFGEDSFFGGAWNRLGELGKAWDPRSIPGNLVAAWNQLDDDFLVAQQMIYAPGDYWNGRKQAGKEFAASVADKCSTPAGAGELYVDLAAIVVAKKVAASTVAVGVETKTISAGLMRRMTYGHLWQQASLVKAIQRHLGDKYTTWITKSGKRIYESSSTGRQIVEDLDGGYFRIFQPSSVGSKNGTYLDLLGKAPAPARVVKGGAVKNVPLSGDALEECTHFLIKE